MSVATLDQQFFNFAKFGDPKADGKTITLSKSDKWLRQANILDDDKITMTDTGIVFSRFKLIIILNSVSIFKLNSVCRSSAINFQDFLKYIHFLCSEKELDLEATKNLLTECGPPGIKEQKVTTLLLYLQKRYFMIFLCLVYRAKEPRSKLPFKRFLLLL